METQLKGNAKVGQNVTWSGRFPSSISPCFHYGEPIKINTVVYSLRDFFAKTILAISKLRVKPTIDYPKHIAHHLQSI